MWILPAALKESYLSALEPVGWSAESNEQVLMCESQLMWRSKLLSAKTWYSKWKKVYWLQHLFGRILKPSLENTFTEKYTASLEDIHVSLSPLPVKEKAQKTPDISGHISQKSYSQLSLFGVSSKTSPVILPSDTSRSDQNYKALVTALKKEYSQRRRLALPTRENDSSSLPSNWQTPRCNDAEKRGCIQSDKRNGLPGQVQNWPTIQAHEARLGYQNRNRGKRGSQKSLTTAVVESCWPTPSSRDFKSGKSNQHGKNSRPLNEVTFLIGQQDQDSSNTTGKRLALNPAWVLQLMGTTIEQTFFEWQEMPSLNKQQH